MKIATWNIGSLKQEYDSNVKILSEALGGNEYDLLFLQEFIPSTEDLITELTGLSCSYYKEFSGSHVSQGEQMGIAVFSRGKIAEKDTYKLVKPIGTFYYNGKEEKMHDKFFVSLEADVCDTKLTVLTGHGFSFHRYGVNPADYPEVFKPLDEWLCSHLQKEQAIAIGDFNISNADVLLPEMASKLKDIFCNVATRPSGRKTDYIFVPKAATVYECGNILCTRAPHYGFDHNFLSATVEMPKHDKG